MLTLIKFEGLPSIQSYVGNELFCFTKHQKINRNIHKCIQME